MNIKNTSIQFTCTLFLSTLLSFIAVNAHAVTAQDSPEFTTSGQSLWGPGQGVTELPWKADIVDIDTNGQFGTILGAKLSLATASPHGDIQFICPTGSFIDLASGDCYECPVTYVHNPLYPASNSKVCTKITNRTTATYKSEPQFICPSGQFPDIATGKCYSCPSGYSHDALIPATIAGVCYKNDTDNMDYKRKIGCDAGELYDPVSDNCFTCPSGYNHDPLIPYNLNGICYKPSQKLTKTMSNVGSRTWNSCKTVVLGVCFGGWDYSGTTSGGIWSGNSYYKCTGGYSHDILVPFNRNGICFKNTSRVNTTASYAGEYQNCQFGELASGGNCYDCPTGYNHDILVPFNQNGICKKRTNTTAALQGNITFICPSGQFFDVGTQNCYTCGANQLHDPIFPATTTGVCYTLNESLPATTGDPQFLCGEGEFADVITGKCYTCPTDHIWNPLVPVDQNGVCFALEVGENLSNPDREVGFVADYEMKIRWGMSGGLNLNSGSVDVDYKPQITVEVKKDASHSGPEDMFILSSSQNTATSTLSLNTHDPSVEVYLDTYMDSKVNINADVAYPGISDTGLMTQEREIIPIMNFDTQGEKTPNPDHPLTKLTLSTSGAQLDVLGNTIFSNPAGMWTYTYAQSLTGVPAKFDESPISLEYTIFEVALGFPSFTTPVDTSCSGVIDCFLKVNGIEQTAPTSFYGDHGSQAVIETGADGTKITNHLKAGNRTGLTLASLLLDGYKSTDAAKLEVDLDGLQTLITKVPLGINVGIQAPIKNNTLTDSADDSESADKKNSNGNITLFNVNGNILDLDAAVYLGFSEVYEFTPNLLVKYDFGQVVSVQDEKGELVEQNHVEVPLGETRKFVHPGGELNITTSYSMRNNQFSNDLDLQLTPVFEGEALSIEYDFFGRPTDLPNKFAAAAFAVQLVPEPLKLINVNFHSGISTDKAEFALAGFEDVEGTSLSVMGSSPNPLDAMEIPMLSGIGLILFGGVTWLGVVLFRRK